jgi:hypothetical protein
VLVFSPAEYGVASDELSQSDLDDALDEAAGALGGADVAGGVAAFIDATRPASLNWPLLIGGAVLVLIVVGVAGRVVERRATTRRRAKALQRRWRQLGDRADALAYPILELETKVDLAGRRDLAVRYGSAANRFAELRDGSTARRTAPRSTVSTRSCPRSRRRSPRCAAPSAHRDCAPAQPAKHPHAVLVMKRSPISMVLHPALGRQPSQPRLSRPALVGGGEGDHLNGTVGDGPALLDHGLRLVGLDDVVAPVGIEVTPEIESTRPRSGPVRRGRDIRLTYGEVGSAEGLEPERHRLLLVAEPETVAALPLRSEPADVGQVGLGSDLTGIAAGCESDDEHGGDDEVRDVSSHGDSTSLTPTGFPGCAARLGARRGPRAASSLTSP